MTVVPLAVLDWPMAPDTAVEWAALAAATGLPAEQLEAEAAATNRLCRQAELVRQHSSAAELVVVTLPLPQVGTPGALYMAWLDLLSGRLPPTLLVRGNQQAVLTFYS